jgi:hypothetical protein
VRELGTVRLDLESTQELESHGTEAAFTEPARVEPSGLGETILPSAQPDAPVGGPARLPSPTRKETPDRSSRKEEVDRQEMGQVQVAAAEMKSDPRDRVGSYRQRQGEREAHPW